MNEVCFPSFVRKLTETKAVSVKLKQFKLGILLIYVKVPKRVIRKELANVKLYLD